MGSKPKIDLLDKKIGDWTVVRFDGVREKKSFWLCRCVCGTERVICRGSLTNGASLSCGCKRITTLKNKFTRHGMSNTSEFRIWESMLKRCKAKHEKNYSGRGIKVCERWLKFENFYEDMGPRPEGHSIDRIDNNGDYEQENCRWADRVTQNNNKRSNRKITFRGQTKTISEWSKITGIKSVTLWHRLNTWKDVNKALTVPTGSIRGNQWS